MTLASRFHSKYKKGRVGECWEWQGSLSPNGYGRIAIGRNKSPVYAHRIAYVLAYGDIPIGVQVCHTCDNRKCVNPRHLWLGSQQDNLEDMRSKGREGGQFKKGHIPWCAGIGKGRRKVQIVCSGCGKSCLKRADHISRKARGPHYCSRLCAARYRGNQRSKGEKL